MTTRKDMADGRRFYDIPEVGVFPSVTTILQIIGKGERLIAWSAKVEREMVLEVSAQLYEDVAETPRMKKTAWLTTMANRLGKEKAHKKEKEKAGDIGKQAHALIEWTLRGRMLQKPGPAPVISDKATWAFMAWEDFAKAVDLKPLYIEQVVWSETHGYAGTLDLVGEIDLNGLIRYFRKKNQEIPKIVAELAKRQTHAVGMFDWKTGKAVYSEAHLQSAAYRQAFREMGHGDTELGLVVRLPKNEKDPEFQVVIAKPEEAMFPKFLNAIQLWTWAQEMDKEYEEKKPTTLPETPKQEESLVPILQASRAKIEAMRAAQMREPGEDDLLASFWPAEEHA